MNRLAPSLACMLTGFDACTAYELVICRRQSTAMSRGKTPSSGASQESILVTCPPSPDFISSVGCEDMSSNLRRIKYAMVGSSFLSIKHEHCDRISVPTISAWPTLGLSAAAFNRW